MTTVSHDVRFKAAAKQITSANELITEKTRDDQECGSD